MLKNSVLNFSNMKYSILFIMLFVISCKKDSVTLSSTIFINSTSHLILVEGYKNGLLNSESSFELSANEAKTVFTLNNRGIGNGLNFGEYYRNVDSFVVKFDNIFKISHYKPNLIGNSLKEYLYNSNRNIYNDMNYLRNMTRDEKHRREWDFKYTFIEQDYLDTQ